MLTDLHFGLGSGPEWLVVELDSASVISLIHNLNFNSHALRSLNVGQDDIFWRHISREANYVADRLARVNIYLQSQCIVHDEAPLHLLPLLRVDGEGVMIASVG